MNSVTKIFLPVCLLYFFGAVAVMAKPLPSLSVQMQWQSHIRFEQSNTIQINVLSHISTSNLTLDIKLPDGVNLIKGEKQYVLDMEKGKVEQIEIEVYINKNANGLIKAEARVGGNGDAMFYSADALTLSSPDISQSIKPRNIEPAFQRTERNGVGLREYQIR